MMMMIIIVMFNNTMAPNLSTPFQHLPKAHLEFRACATGICWSRSSGISSPTARQESR